jgi:hypothetical protein
VFKINKNSILHNTAQDKMVIAFDLFKNLKPGEYRVNNCNLWNLNLNVVGYKDTSKNVYYLATNENPHEAIDLYARRWQIETIFFV